MKVLKFVAHLAWRLGSWLLGMILTIAAIFWGLGLLALWPISVLLLEGSYFWLKAVVVVIYWVPFVALTLSWTWEQWRKFNDSNT